MGVLALRYFQAAIAVAACFPPKIAKRGFVMATASQTAAVRPDFHLAGRGGLVDKYFYFAMSLVMAGIVVWGFSKTVDHNLIHAAPPRPMVLWFHGAVFSTWVLFFIRGCPR
jgi:hypothetical protein